MSDTRSTTKNDLMMLWTKGETLGHRKMTMMSEFGTSLYVTR